MKRVAVIGCGEIGGPVAQRIGRVFPVIACDQSVARRQMLQSLGIATTDKVSDCSMAQVALICVSTQEQVESVVDQIKETPGDIRSVAILSTVSPDAVIAARHTLAAYAIGVIDAPVSGGSTSAQAGTLTVMVGGDDAALESVRAVLECFSAHLIHCGGAGDGQRTKIVNNVLCHANTILMAEALRIGRAFGLPVEAIASVMEVSTGRNYLTATPPDISDFYASFASNTERFNSLLKIFSKDLSIAERLAADAGLNLPAISALSGVAAHLGGDTQLIWSDIGSKPAS